MCGRYSLATDLEDIQRRFEFFDSELTHSPRYNIAPTQPVLAVTNDEGRQPAYLRWGLIPLTAHEVGRLLTRPIWTPNRFPEFVLSGSTSVDGRRTVFPNLCLGYHYWHQRSFFDIHIIVRLYAS